jgi:hypothetical protein
MINTKLQSIIDTKSAIGNAIVNKGGTVTSETPFFNYAAQIDGISTGTPQTIFEASDGSKWALTNAVNLVNDAGNVTHDFNYWQPANNSTSDPILNVGTVGANISGNIQLVPVNQVNISQYTNFVATDIDGAKYEGFNGYDSVTNPTPTNTATFNRWLLNNSATGTVIFANAVFTTGTYNGPNGTLNEANMAFIGNTVSYGATIQTITVNNGFIYAGGQGNNTANNDIKKYHESNLVFVGNSNGYGSSISAIAANNGFIYVGGGFGTSNNTVKRFHESNLVFDNNTVNYGAGIEKIAINNGFIYVAGGLLTGTNRGVSKFNESTLALVSNTVNYGGRIFALAINNGFIYIGGESNFTVQKFYEDNLAFVGNTVSAGATPQDIGINNGFLYVGANNIVQKFYESNLAFVENSVDNFSGLLVTLLVNDGFVYAGGSADSFSNGIIKKYYESNLAFLANSPKYSGGMILNIANNNGFLYAGGESNRTVQKFQEKEESLESLTFYTATKIKE